MTPLRRTLIEAMADAWARFEEGPDYEMSGLAFDRLREVAEVQLDTMLTVLAEHADEWEEAAVKAGEPWSISSYLAVLRDGRTPGP
jgi:hypothetical protein